MESLRSIILVPENKTTYSYELWLRGRRRLYLWGRREPDMFIDNIAGTSFNDACYFFYAYTKNEKYYKRRRNKYKGHDLITHKIMQKGWNRPNSVKRLW